MIIIDHLRKYRLLTIMMGVILLLLAACSDTETSPPSGMDVSHFQGEINWAHVATDKDIKFSFIKVSEGITNTDPRAERNWRGAKAAHVIRGGYHVFTAGDGGEAQARHFLETLRSIKADYNGAIPPALDIEKFDKSQLPTVRTEIKKWLDYVEKELRCKPMIYTSPGTWNGKAPAEFYRYPLWLADWGRNTPPENPIGWDTWTFWQHNNRGSARGIKGNLDLDLFNGNYFKLITTTCIGW